MTDFNFFVNYENGDRIKLLENVSFDDISREGMKNIETKIGNAVLFTLHLEEEQKLIFRKRGRTSPGIEEKDNIEPIIYIVGWRQKVGGKDIQSITYICDWPTKGFQIHQAGKFKDDHPFFYSPNLHIEEVFEGERYYDPKNKMWKTK